MHKAAGHGSCAITGDTQLDRRALIAGGAVTALAVMLGGCNRTPAAPTTVIANRYDSFWLWATVRSQRVLDTAKSVYVLALALEEWRGATTLAAQRQAMPRIHNIDIWMVVRVETLKDTDRFIAPMMRVIDSWEKAGNRVVGMQIDFDAGTQGLANYAAFLRKVRRQLPERYKLSITGLLDWAPNGSSDGLRALRDVVDELIIQTYQDRDTLADAERYLSAANRLPMPFKIGLVQNGRLPDMKGADKLPNFEGYVVFLVN
jgi:hypothetical protein